MGNIIILEGPDCTGKTTFAKMLEWHYQYEYHHEGVPNPKWRLYTRFSNQLKDAFSSDLDHVFDRHFIGEWVYGPRHRGHAQYELEVFEELLKAVEAKIVLFNTDWETQLETWKSRRDSEWTQDESVLRRDYERWLKVPDHLDVIHFDYAKDSYAWLVELLGEDASVLTQS